jgi:hypothetical protein
MAPYRGLFLIVSFIYSLMDLPLDPSEAIGTPEYEEIFQEQDDKRRMLLDMIEEDRMYHHLQYPYRHSN